MTTALSGCQKALGLSRPQVGIELFNHTSEAQPLRIELLRPTETTHTEALAFEREFEVPPRREDETGGVVREREIADRRTSIVRVLLKHEDGQWEHHHFYPGESSSEQESAGITVRIFRNEKTGELSVRFR